MRRAVAFAGLLLICCCAVAQADSLWKSDSESLVADRKAHRVGDILTVLIVESSSAKHEAKSDTSKKMDAQATRGTGLLRLFPSLSVSADRSTSGSCSSEQTTTLVDRMSVKVVAVLSNRVLRIEGERVVNLRPDEIKLSVTGCVRSEDVAADNTVTSANIADLKVTTAGKGPIAEKQKPGLIARLLHFLW